MRAMGVLGGVLGVPLSGEFRRWSGLGVVGALVSCARTVQGGWVVLVRALEVLVGLDEAGFVGLLGGGSAASMFVPCVDPLP